MQAKRLGADSNDSNDHRTQDKDILNPQPGQPRFNTVLYTTKSFQRLSFCV